MCPIINWPSFWAALKLLDHAGQMNLIYDDNLYFSDSGVEVRPE